MLSTDLAASPDDRVLPAYAGRSILNVVTSLTAQLGLPPATAPFSAPEWQEGGLLEGVERVLLFVVDGLGHYLLKRHIERGEMPWLTEQLAAEDSGWSYTTATSTLPSSTMTALTTMHTGVPPAQHGWLGTTVFQGKTVIDLLRQTDVLAAKPLPDPNTLIFVPSVYRCLHDIGVSSGYVSPAAYEGQFLDHFYFDGGTAFRYGPHASLPLQVANAAAQSGSVQSGAVPARYVMSYWPDYDTTNHIHGPQSEASAQAAGTVDTLIRHTLDALPRDGHTLLVVTADHGQRVTPLGEVVSVGTVEAPPAGENRLRYFTHEPQGLSAGVTVRLSADLWAEGLFGGPPARLEFLERTGTYTATVQDAAQLTHDYGAGPLILKGNHGGWSAEEMVVPVLSIRL